MRKIPERKKARTELLALMDMIFLLLVLFIFMLVQTRPNFGIEVTLPEVGEEMIEKVEIKEEEKMLTLSVTDKNKLFLNEKSIEFENMIPEITTFAAGTPLDLVNVILSGDSKADYGFMLNLLTTLRKNKMNKVVFDVNKKSKGETKDLKEGN